ncbi:ATP-binding protein, partial [candidate division KSB1 bacterium]|nr:ATP-binding protein [candidate division KSB1 bacterium]
QTKGGTGLGLMICQRIVKDHRGDIALSSTWGKGTTVRIELPASEHRSKRIRSTANSRK